jgi:branched-chain amino acid transport system ATP-binding protein
MTLLELQKISKHFGGVTAISELDMKIRKGEISGLIGPNGAGKTTVFNVITGIYKPSKGKVIFDGKDITGLEPHFVAKNGIVRTFQLTTLFSGLSALENVLIGLQLVSRIGFWDALSNSRSNRRKEKELKERAMEILGFMGLANFKDEKAKNLPYGLQKALSISIALASKPKVLLLDEPLTGMNPKEVTEMINLIRLARDREKLTIAIVEHNMRAVMSLCERITVISFGRKIAEGTPDEVRENPEVINAYLGVQNV